VRHRTRVLEHKCVRMKAGQHGNRLKRSSLSGMEQDPKNFSHAACSTLLPAVLADAERTQCHVDRQMCSFFHLSNLPGDVQSNL